MHIHNNFNDYSVHECLYENIASIENEKLLRFIPPTGNFNLFYYNIKNLNVKLPFEVIPRIEIFKNKVLINVKVESRMLRGTTYDVDDMHIKFLLPEGLK